MDEHKACVPRDHSLGPWEREALIGYCRQYPSVGYRRVTYMMLDADVAAVSPATADRVLRQVRLLRRWNNSPSTTGRGFNQPLTPHEHWHADIAHLNIAGTFHLLGSVRDGFWRFIVHWQLASLEHGHTRRALQPSATSV